MGCCGKKRAQLAHGRMASSPVATFAPDEGSGDDQRKARVFRFTGATAVAIKGINSGRVYHFLPGATVEVAYEDSFAMMAERDLRPE